MPAIKPTWIALGLLSIALAFAIGTARSQYERAERYQAEVKALKVELAALKESAASKDVVIDDFIKATEAAATILADQNKALDKAATRVRALRAELTETRHKLQLLEESDYAISECAALLNADLGVCPGHVLSLRERAYGGIQGPGSVRPTTDSSADRPAPNQ